MSALRDKWIKRVFDNGRKWPSSRQGTPVHIQRLIRTSITTLARQKYKFTFATWFCASTDARRVPPDNSFRQSRSNWRLSNHRLMKELIYFKQDYFSFCVCHNSRLHLRDSIHARAGGIAFTTTEWNDAHAFRKLKSNERHNVHFFRFLKLTVSSRQCLQPEMVIRMSK